MKVISYSGYYPNRAHEQLAKRTEDYWNAYFYVLAVKIGSFKKSFYINTPTRINITKNNFDEVRKTFGKWAAEQAPTLSNGTVKLVPVPSKDGVKGAAGYRSLKMAEEAFAGTTYKSSVADGLRWNKQASAAHVGGSRSRAVLLPMLETTASLKKADQVILIDDVYSTGGSLLASSDRLTASGANVLGAITCGKTVYDFNTPAFGTHEFDLTTELSDWPLA
jgi:hypothetical protein